MPELPEVETVMHGLEPHLAGARLLRVAANRPDLRFPLPDGFVQRLTGARIDALARRGKYILASLDRGDTLIMHLGMSGRFVVESDNATAMPGAFALAAPADARHAHVVFETDRGACITYHDARRFGFMDLADSAALESHPRFADMGPEPLGPDFDAGVLRRAFAGRKQGAKTLLLDQTIVAGLGNIYVCEALHRARVSPLKPAAEISARACARLSTAIREVLLAAIEAGGSTLRDFASADGALGYFQHSFRVYGREGEPCANPGCAGRVKRIVQSGRSTFACSRCQR